MSERESEEIGRERRVRKKGKKKNEMGVNI